MKTKANSFLSPATQTSLLLFDHLCFLPHWPPKRMNHCHSLLLTWKLLWLSLTVCLYTTQAILPNSLEISGEGIKPLLFLCRWLIYILEHVCQERQFNMHKETLKIFFYPNLPTHKIARNEFTQGNKIKWSTKHIKHNILKSDLINTFWTHFIELIWIHFKYLQSSVSLEVNRDCEYGKVHFIFWH